MWICPKCGHSFKSKGQSHYCGKPPATIAEYISSQPEETQDYLLQINAAIRASIPDAEEKISWSMADILEGLQSDPVRGIQFVDRLTEYKTSKGTIQFPYTKLLPLELSAEIAKWCEESK